MKKDFYTRQAKKEGLRARSAYKLIQMNNVYRIINKGNKVLDLGCWPGGWMIASKQIGAQVTGIDLKEIEPIQGTEFIRGDVFDDCIIEPLPVFDVIISDLAPKTTGIHHLDVGRSTDLVQRALDIADKKLIVGGNFLCKVFEGQGFQEVLARIRKKFKVTRIAKPEASKRESREIYLLGLFHRG